MGATVYDRSHHLEATFSTVAQAELFDIDTVVMPDKVVAGKGAGMDSLLKSGNHARNVHHKQVYDVGRSEPSTNCCQHARKATSAL
jgi:hypothetical protein